MRAELTGEAIRLTRVLRQLLPEEPEVAGLLGLLLLTEARREPRVRNGRRRTSPGGDYGTYGQSPLGPKTFWTAAVRLVTWSRA